MKITNNQNEWYYEKLKDVSKNYKGFSYTNEWYYHCRHNDKGEIISKNFNFLKTIPQKYSIYDKNYHLIAWGLNSKNAVYKHINSYLAYGASLKKYVIEHNLKKPTRQKEVINFLNNSKLMPLKEMIKQSFLLDLKEEDKVFFLKINTMRFSEILGDFYVYFAYFFEQEAFFESQKKQIFYPSLNEVKNAYRR